ncbi:hypothetical protein ACN47E_008811 [Coniothyrium glycines]
MLFTKPLTTGLILATLAAVTHGRAIQYPKHVTDDLSEREFFDLNTIEENHFEPESHLALLGDQPFKRAPPRVTRPGREGEGTGQDGGGAQTGGGSQQGGGSQTGGNRQEGAGAPPATNPGPGPAAPDGTPPLAAYADIPPNFNNPNRVPGQTVLPNEIPNQPGLSTDAADAARRVSFQRFVNWDIQSSNIIPRDIHYLFYVGDRARDTRIDFKNDFNSGKHREGLPADDRNFIVDNTNVYTGIDTGADKVPVPAGQTKDIWLGLLESYGTAKRAAARGGIVRVLVDEKPGTNAPNRDRLNEEGSFFYNFELATLTAPDSRIQSIQAYGATFVNGARGFTPPTEIWRAGQPQMGKTPNWIEGTKPKDQRTGVPEEDDLFDIGDLLKRA